MEGYRIKEFKKVENINYAIGYTKTIEFTEEDIPGYMSRFYELKKSKVIIEGEFEENKWTLRGKERKAHLTFKYEFNKKLNLAIKAFVLIKICDKKVDPRTTISDLHGIDFIIKHTNCLDINKVDQLADHLELKKDSYIINEVINGGYDFLCFYNHLKLTPLRKLIDKYDYTKSGSRVIPSFKSIIFFDDILNDFIEFSTKTDKEKYFPVVLWWSITRCIPMRPVEFSELETNSAKIVNGKYILSIVNAKEISTMKKLGDQEYRHVEITKGLYDLIQEYINFSNPKRKEKYLFTYNVYAKYYKSNRELHIDIDNHEDIFAGTERFYSLLNNFYEEIIEKRYGYITIPPRKERDINNGELFLERIRPGDTRHFAICNLYLQGVNPLTIARLAGHDTIYTQLSYSDHMNVFAESKVKLLTDEIRRLRDLGDSLIMSTQYKTLYKKSLFFNTKNYKDLRSVENGYCIDREYPENCLLGSCEQCDFYRLDINNKDFTSLRIESESHAKEISKQINIMKTIIKKSNVNKNNVEKNKYFDVMEQEQFGICSKKLQEAISRKAIIDSYILKKSEVE